MSDWISQKNKKRAEKRRERVEVLKGLAWNEDDEALAAAAQHELLQRTKPPGRQGPRARRRRSNSSRNLADEDDDDEAPPVAEVEVDVAELHKNSGRRRKPCGRRAAAAKVAANADKDLVAKAGRRAALEADEKAARRAVEDADAKHAAARAAAELSLLSRRRRREDARRRLRRQSMDGDASLDAHTLGQFGVLRAGYLHTGASRWERTDAALGGSQKLRFVAGDDTSEAWRGAIEAARRDAVEGAVDFRGPAPSPSHRAASPTVVSLVKSVAGGDANLISRRVQENEEIRVGEVKTDETLTLVCGDGDLDIDRPCSRGARRRRGVRRGAAGPRGQARARQAPGKPGPPSPSPAAPRKVDPGDARAVRDASARTGAPGKFIVGTGGDVRRRRGAGRSVAVAESGVGGHGRAHPKFAAIKRHYPTTGAAGAWGELIYVERVGHVDAAG
ncbi:hypothetical protein JL721_9474 [Aureococcus anophagefferens]|nr:hypothetical protein JL721_9474 [Aureococcus anophagefferens]